MVVVACKADSTVISSDAVADILDPFHVGLVETTATTEKGKDKMRMALAWTIQVSRCYGTQARLSSRQPPGHRPPTSKHELFYQPCRRYECCKIGNIHEPNHLIVVIRTARRQFSLKTQIPSDTCQSK
jgi:hypothetical protein